MGDRIGEGIVDLFDFGQNSRIIKVEVMCRQQKLAICSATTPQIGHHQAHQPDQATGLLKALVFAEAGIQVTNHGMKGVALHDIDLELIGGFHRNIHLTRMGQCCGITHRHCLHRCGVGKCLKQAFAQNIVELIGIELHRGNALRKA